jgi:hypothetical protein
MGRRVEIPTGARVAWLVEVYFGGVAVRMSTEDVIVETAAGEELHFAGVLPELDVVVALSEIGGVQSAPSLSFEAVWPVAVAELVEDGWPLAYSRARVSRWVEGTTYESRRVVVDGYVHNPTYGEEDEPTAVTIEAPPWEATASLPPPGAEVNGYTFASAVTSLAPEQLGRVYPVVFGSPGQVAARVDATERQAATKARWIDQRYVAMPSPSSDYSNVRVLVAGHHVSAERCYLYNADGMVSRVFLRNGFDDLGQPIAFVPWFYDADVDGAPDDDFDAAYMDYYCAVTDFDGATTSAMGDASLTVNEVVSGDNTPELFVAWADDEDLSRGGLDGDAGSVIEYLVRRMGLPVDAGMFAAAKQLLSVYRLDFAIDETCNVWDFVRAQLLPILPVSLVTGPLGVYPVVWRFDATAADAVEHFNLDLQTDVDRLGGIETETSQMCNEVTIKYARSARSGSSSATLTFGGDRYDADRADRIPEPAFRRSQQRLRDLSGQPLVLHKDLDLPVVGRDATVTAIAGWYAAAYGLPLRYLRLVADEARCQHISEGAIVTVTDARVHLDQAVCMVTEIAYGTDAPLELRLVMLGAKERSRG